MTTTVSPVATVHEQMHNYADEEQRDEQPVARKYMNTMLKSEQETHSPKECEERYPRARLPEAIAACSVACFFLMVSMLDHFLDTPILDISIKSLQFEGAAR